MGIAEIPMIYFTQLRCVSAVLLLFYTNLSKSNQNWDPSNVVISGYAFRPLLFILLDKYITKKEFWP